MKLRETQQRFAAALMTPLAGDGRIGRRTSGRTRLENEAAEMVRPNDRLTSFERLEIYRRSYWFRLLDSIRDDYPGLKAILGGDRFDKLATAYLVDCPSESFTLRDLGSRLAAWLEANPRYGGANRDLALDMARLEWAHVVAFDGPEGTILGLDDLIEPAPDLRLGLQPYITLLELRYPVDVIKVRLRRSLEGEKSNAPSPSNSNLRRQSSDRPRLSASFWLCIGWIRVSVIGGSRLRSTGCWLHSAAAARWQPPFK